jgi:hypothetical protein
LVVIDESSSQKNKFLNNFDKFKAYIKSDRITIEPKGVNQFEVINRANYVINSNHIDRIFIENETDRRYLCLEVNEKYVGDYEYWDNLRQKCFNQEAENHFYTYISRLQNPRKLMPIPNTSFRRVYRLT